MKTHFIKKHHHTIKQILFLLLLLYIPVYSFSQEISDLSNVKVEELTDDQIRKFVTESTRLGVNINQIEELAQQKGMSPLEAVKLKERIKLVNKNFKQGDDQNQTIRSISENRLQDSINKLEQKPVGDINTVFGQLKARNFGSGVFSNPRITFEPNLRIPTPKNYQLAADDELVIDVTGYSEANYRLKISPEGIIRIPVVGAISLNGLTIEQAKRAISQRLANTIYSDIKSGQTSVEVNLASIRSIKITIIGEATLPGTYTLPSLASAYNALYACGGPNENGSFRNIQVIRNNSTVATIDVYDYLVNGSKRNDIRLMDQDVIKINTYNVRIELKGEVKKPGLYDVSRGESLAKIIRYAGGFTDNAYTARINVFRNTSVDREVTTISTSQLESIIPQKGDSYTIGKILNRFANRVSIRGAVYRPGEFEMKEGITLSKLIAEADGLREDAFTSRATIHRLKADLSPEIVSVELDKILSSAIPDITLRREDRIQIYSKFELKEGYYITIGGEVANPGVFLYEDGMSVQDLILMAGGLKETASTKRIEVSRRVKDADPKSSNPKTAVIFEQDITADLKSSPETAKLILSPYDEVFVRPAPGYFSQKNVVIEGEIIYAGKYTLSAKNDRISDLVKRAGGLTPQAYLNGAVLVRSRQFSKTEQNNSQQGFTNLLKQNYEAGVPTAILQNDIQGAVLKKSDNVGIELKKILENPASQYDLFLNDGDTLRIPKQLQTVRVNGEVLYPALVRYARQYNFKDYVILSGGFGERASKKRSYAVYANGSVKGTKTFLFFKDYPRVTAGTEIFVPARKEREKIRPMEIISIVTALASTAAILFTISK
ncbi:MAG: SLBB domain-containing protein [Pyrinomonadaceae bacterium]|nr:SLBB domain-containing protein [Sphingobacteriaceae bacterium]